MIHGVEKSGTATENSCTELKGCLPGSQMQSSYCVLRQQEQGSYLGPVKRALILFIRASPLWPNHLPKTLPPNMSHTLGISFDIWMGGVDISIWSIEVSAISMDISEQTKWHINKAEETGTPIHHWWECEMVQLLWKIVWKFLKKVNRITIWSRNSTYRYTTQSKQRLKQYIYVHRSLIHNSQKKQPKCLLMDEWIK